MMEIFQSFSFLNDMIIITHIMITGVFIDLDGYGLNDRIIGLGVTFEYDGITSHPKKFSDG